MFPRKSFRFLSLSDQPTWLLLAQEALFWQLTGTILGTVFAPSALSAPAAKPLMIAAPTIAGAAPDRSVRVGARPSVNQSHTSDAAM
jgi:hypothetical protein